MNFVNLLKMNYITEILSKKWLLVWNTLPAQNKIICKKLIYFAYYAEILVQISPKKFSLDNIKKKLAEYISDYAIQRIIDHENIYDIMQMGKIRAEIIKIQIEINHFLKIEKNISVILNQLEYAKTNVFQITNKFLQNYIINSNILNKLFCKKCDLVLQFIKCKTN